MTSPLNTRDKFDFQRDLIKTNGLLQSLVTDMRYHCEVYKLSLRSINKILKQLKQEQTTDISTFCSARLKHTARSSYQRDIILVSQKRGLEKINSVLHKARTFINGYSLLEKAVIENVEMPEIELKRDLCSTELHHIHSTQSVGDPSPSEKEQSLTLVQANLLDEHLISNVEQKQGSKLTVQIENPGKSFQTDLNITQQESQLQGMESFPTAKCSPEKNIKIRLDETVNESRDNNNTSFSSYQAGQKLTTRDRYSSEAYSRLKRDRQRESRSWVIKKDGLKNQQMHHCMSKNTGMSAPIGNQKSFKTIGQGIAVEQCSIETVQTRRVTRCYKYPGTWNRKYNWYQNYNNMNKHLNETPRKWVNNHRYPQAGLVAKTSNIFDPIPLQRKHFHPFDSTSNQGDYLNHQQKHQYRHEGKVRRVDIDPQNYTGENAKLEQVEPMKRISKCRASDYSYPYGFHADTLSKLVKPDNAVISTQGSKIQNTNTTENPLQNSKITTTLIPTVDNDVPVFMEDPRLVRKKQIEECKSLETKATRI